jgi:hypothetical protein
MELEGDPPASLVPWLLGFPASLEAELQPARSPSAKAAKHHANDFGWVDVTDS